MTPEAIRGIIDGNEEEFLKELGSLDTLKLEAEILSLKDNIESKFSGLKNKFDSETQMLKALYVVKESMGQDFFDLVILGKEVKGYSLDANKFSTQELFDMIEELLILESSKSLATVKTIEITLEELKEVEQIAAKKDTQKQLKDFVKEQFNENISTKEIFVGSKSYNKIVDIFSEEGKDGKESAEQFLDSIDNSFRILIKKQMNISPETFSEDAINNFASGLSFGVMGLLGKFTGEKREAFIKSFKQLDFTNPVNSIIGVVSTLTKGEGKDVLVESGIQDVLPFLSDVESYFDNNNLQGEKNKVIMTPHKTAMLMEAYIKEKDNKKRLQIVNSELAKNNIDKKETINVIGGIDSFDSGKTLLENMVVKMGLDNQDIVDGITAETVKGIYMGTKFMEKAAGATGFLKDQLLVNKGLIGQMKGFLEGFGAWKFFEKIFKFLLKFAGLNPENFFDKKVGVIDKRQLNYANDINGKYKSIIKDGKINNSKSDKEIIDNLDPKFDGNFDQGKYDETFGKFNVAAFKESLKQTSIKGVETFGKYKLSESIINIALTNPELSSIKNNVIKNGKIDKIELNKHEETIVDAYIKFRLNDALNSKVLTKNLKSDNDVVNFISLEHAKSTIALKNVRETEKSMQMFEEKIESPEYSDFKKYKADIENAADHPRVQLPRMLLLWMLNKEGSEGNPDATPGTSSAKGLGQITDDTWKDVLAIVPGLDRNNPSHQILGMGVLLRKHLVTALGDLEKAIVYYHTGAGIDGLNDSKIKEYLDKNPAIKSKVKEIYGKVTGINNKQYQQGAKAYYKTAEIVSQLQVA